MSTTSQVEHANRGHAVWAPSSAERWLHCTASAESIAMLPEQEEGDAARAGTEAHEEIERCFGPLNGETVDPATMPIKPVDLDHPAAYGIAMMIAYVRQLPPGRMWIEKRVALTKDVHGTPDVRHWDPMSCTLTVPDYKNGFVGVDADAEQLKIYAAASVYTDNLPIKWARLVIVQPNDFRPVPRVKQHVMSADELFAFAQQVADAVASPKKFVAGQHCTYCPLFGRCEASRDVLVQLSAMLANPPDAIPPAQWAIFKACEKPVTDWFKNGDKAQTKLALTKGAPEGMKLVTSQKHKAWKDAEAARRLVLERLGPDALDVPTPSQAIERGIPEDVVNAMAPRPDGAPVLAFASDKRPEWRTKSVAEMFKDVVGK